MPDPKKPARLRNLTLAGIAGLAGFWIIVVVFGALIAGLWLDARFSVRGPFTIGLVLCSMPVTLIVVLRIVLRLVSSIQPPQKSDDQGTNTTTRGG